MRPSLAPRLLNAALRFAGAYRAIARKDSCGFSRTRNCALRAAGPRIREIRPGLRPQDRAFDSLFAKVNAPVGMAIDEEREVKPAVDEQCLFQVEGPGAPGDSDMLGVPYRRRRARRPRRCEPCQVRAVSRGQCVGPIDGVMTAQSKMVFVAAQGGDGYLVTGRELRCADFGLDHKGVGRPRGNGDEVKAGNCDCGNEAGGVENSLDGRNHNGVGEGFRSNAVVSDVRPAYAPPTT